MTSFRHTIDLNFARRSIGNTMIAQIVQLLHYLRKRYTASHIVETMISGSEAEFRRIFRLSRTVLAALVVELSP